MAGDHLQVRPDSEGLKGLPASTPLKIIQLYHAHSLRPNCRANEHQSRERTLTSLLEDRFRATL